MSAEWHAAARHALEQQCRECDIVITTALIPGKPAPRLIHEDMVALLKPGSVVVDLATEAGTSVSPSIRAACRVLCVLLVFLGCLAGGGDLDVVFVFSTRHRPAS